MGKSTARTRKGKRLEVILVEWIDSSHHEGWQHPEDCSIVKNQSVGFSVEDNQEFIKIADSRSMIGGYMPFADITCIPKVAIKKVTIIKKVV